MDAERMGGGGAWRAFIHVEAHGQKLTDALAADLSQRYHALTDVEFEYYNTLGDFATRFHRGGAHAFGPRRQSKRAAPRAAMLCGSSAEAGAVVTVTAAGGLLVVPDNAPNLV